MEYDKKQFLDLLLEYRSDEAKKARRNVSAIAFMIFVAWLLNLHLSEINVFGMNVSRASEIQLLVVAFILLIYWLGMFILALLQDSEIQKERSLILKERVTYFEKRLEIIEKRKEKGGGPWEFPDYNEVITSVEAYRLQQQRTKRAIKVVALMRRFESYVPIALAVIAVLALAKMFYDAI